MKKTIVIAAVVLAAAMTSGATAARVVHTQDIANGAVTHAKLAGNSARHANIGSGSVEANNLDFDIKTHLAPWFLAYPHRGDPAAERLDQAGFRI